MKIYVCKPLQITKIQTTAPRSVNTVKPTLRILSWFIAPGDASNWVLHNLIYFLGNIFRNDSYEVAQYCLVIYYFICIDTFAVGILLDVFRSQSNYFWVICILPLDIGSEHPFFPFPPPFFFIPDNTINGVLIKKSLRKGQLLLLYST